MLHTLEPCINLYGPERTSLNLRGNTVLPRHREIALLCCEFVFAQIAMSTDVTDVLLFLPAANSVHPSPMALVERRSRSRRCLLFASPSGTSRSRRLPAVRSTSWRLPRESCHYRGERYRHATSDQSVRKLATFTESVRYSEMNILAGETVEDAFTLVYWLFNWSVYQTL